MKRIAQPWLPGRSVLRRRVRLSRARGLALDAALVAGPFPAIGAAAPSDAFLAALTLASIRDAAPWLDPDRVRLELGAGARWGEFARLAGAFARRRVLAQGRLRARVSGRVVLEAEATGLVAHRPARGRAPVPCRLAAFAKALGKRADRWSALGAWPLEYLVALSCHGVTRALVSPRGLVGLSLQVLEPPPLDLAPRVLVDGPRATESGIARVGFRIIGADGVAARGEALLPAQRTGASSALVASRAARAAA
jgi:hypothetical protein